VHPNSKVTLFRGIFGQNLEKYRHQAVVRHRLPQPDDNRMALRRKEGLVTEKVKQLVLLQFSPGKAPFYLPFSKVKQVVLLFRISLNPLCLSAFQRGLGRAKSEVKLGVTLEIRYTSVTT
jgi:hypothetical protein